MPRSTLILLIAIVLLGGWVGRLSIVNARLRTAAAAQASRSNVPAAPTVVTAAGHGGPAMPGAGEPSDRSAVPRVPGSAASVRQPAPAASLPAAFSARVERQPDGSVMVHTGDGTLLPPLSAEAARELAQSLQSALLDASATEAGGPSWSPGQVAGPPDTDEYGDYATAWASRNPDGGIEWLQVEFERPVEVGEIVIHESFNPGALAKVSALMPDGAWKTLWEGTTPAEGESVERALAVPPGVTSDQIRIELDTRRVPGWNEIDAVQLVGTDGSRQWARRATASSHYGQDRGLPLETRSLRISGMIRAE